MAANSSATHTSRNWIFWALHPARALCGSPRATAVPERFIRTLKEQLLWIQAFDTVEELRQALLAWRDMYNDKWDCAAQQLPHAQPGQDGALASRHGGVIYTNRCLINRVRYTGVCTLCCYVRASRLAPGARTTCTGRRVLRCRRRRPKRVRNGMRQAFGHGAASKFQLVAGLCP